MTKAIRILLPIAVLTLCWWFSKRLFNAREEPPRRPPVETVTGVDATRLTPASYQVVIPTRGNVRPRTESTLIPEVPGAIIAVSPSLREGGFFEKGDVLLEIDPTDYEAAAVVARGNLAQAESTLEQEKARAAQALENWQRLGKEGEPNALARREPQLAEAQAAVAAATAQVAKADRDLERTKITAPFDGRILEKSADVGQYVTSGTVLARAYATDIAEVRLPLSNDQLAFLDLPELYEGESREPGSPGPAVELTGVIGGKPYTWEGELVRVAGEIDERSRQLFVVAQVPEPYARRADGRPPLKIGLFVEALIQGRTLEGVFVIPRAAVRAGDEILLIDEKNHTLVRHHVEPLWRDDESVVVDASSIEPGLLLCLTPLPFPADGAKVSPTVDGAPPAPPAQANRQDQGPPPAGKPPKPRT